MFRHKLALATMLTVATPLALGAASNSMGPPGMPAMPAAPMPVLLEGRYSAESLLRVVPENERSIGGPELAITEM